MKKYLCRWAALKTMNIPFFEGLFPPEITEDVQQPQSIVFGKRPRKEPYSAHVEYCTRKIPPGTVQRGKNVVSPEFSFLQVSHDLDLQQRVLLGLMMFAAPQGQPEEAVTTVEKLLRFVTACVGYRGRATALQSLQYIQDGARSPMEAELYMVLCLPNHWGGAGFTGGILNHEIVLEPEVQMRWGNQRFYADIAFPEQMLVIEYDGEDHKDAKQRARDARKDEILESIGWTVLRVRKQELYSLERLHNLIRAAAAALGKKIRIRAKNYTRAFLRIYALLPGDNSKIVDYFNPRRQKTDFLRQLPRKFKRFYERIGVPLRILSPT